MKTKIIILVTSQALFLSLLSKVVVYAQIADTNQITVENNSISLPVANNDYYNIVYENAKFKEECAESIRCAIVVTDEKCIQNKDRILNLLPRCQKEGSVVLVGEDDEVIQNKQDHNFECSFSMAKCLSAAAAQAPVVVLGETLSVKENCNDVHSKCKDSDNALKFSKFCKNIQAIIKSYGDSTSALYKYPGCDLDQTPIIPIATPFFEGGNHHLDV